jgi:uncharacterized protein (DUF2235 family)
MALYAFDGTWNREQDQAHYSRNSNVVKFAKAYLGRKVVYQKDGDRVHVVEDDDTQYIDGVGTRHGIAGKIAGGIFGAGGRTRIREAVSRVERKFAEGDRDIDVVGFSRGAALALHFVNVLADDGIKGPDGKRIKPRVRFLGLWDVVASFGVAKDIGPFAFHDINLGWKLKLPPIVDRCFHAIATDERRETFRATRVQGAYEVWFRGVHSDVGGGNENEGLNNIALAWMLRKAAAVGLPVDRDAAGKLPINADAAVRPSSKDLRKDPFRVIAPKEWIHYTLRVRKHADCQNPPAGCQVETPELESKRISLG